MFSVAMLAVGMFSTSAFASTTKNWTVNYTPGAPSGSANPVQYVYFDEDNNIFTARCTSFSGPSGKRVTITGEGVQLSRDVYFQVAGDVTTFTTNNSTVRFRVALTASSNSSASGSITCR